MAPTSDCSCLRPSLLMSFLLKSVNIGEVACTVPRPLCIRAVLLKDDEFARNLIYGMRWLLLTGLVLACYQEQYGQTSTDHF